MGRRNSVAVRTLWQSRLRRFESLNQTIAEFCRWEGVSTAAFYLWRKKLRGEAPANQRPLFVPVVPTVGSVRESGSVVMILPAGIRVELPTGDHQLIAHVVKSVADLRGGDR